MEDKELEKKLQESADNMKMKEFSAVWADIGGEAQIRSSEKRRQKRWITAGAAACLALVCCVGLIIGLYVRPEDTVYYYPGSLGTTAVEMDKFETELAKAGIFPVDFFRYEVSSVILLKTNDTLKTKGGIVGIGYDLEEPTFLLEVWFYDQTVLIKDTYLGYDHYFTANSAQIWYDVKEYDETDGYRVYAVTAKQKGLTYVMEYAVFTDDIEEFLTEFFA